MNLHNTDLSIGELARHSGVSVSTLRAWEQRYGFPVPARLGSGHRRYSNRDLEAVRAVTRERRSGTSLATALAQARSERVGQRASVFGAMREALPEIPPARMSKPSMIRLSHAFEDEIASRAERPLLIAGFQRERFWQASEARWRNLAQISSLTVVLASFRRARTQGALWLVPVARDQPILREWVVVCDSPTFSACLAAVELPETSARTFEVLWSTDPATVREVARTAAGIATANSSARQPQLAEVVGDRLTGPASAGYDVFRSTTSLTNRIVGYMASPTVALARS